MAWIDRSFTRKGNSVCGLPASRVNSMCLGTRLLWIFQDKWIATRSCSYSCHFSPPWHCNLLLVTINLATAAASSCTQLSFRYLQPISRGVGNNSKTIPSSIQMLNCFLYWLKVTHNISPIQSPSSFSIRLLRATLSAIWGNLLIVIKYPTLWTFSHYRNR